MEVASKEEHEELKALVLLQGKQITALMNGPKLPDWVTMAQAEEMLNLERKTVRKLITKGDILAKQGLRKIEISSKSILEYNLKHTIK
jgi:hypothetical protein